MTANRFGVDQDYFEEKLALLQRDLGNHTPQELARTLARLAKVADAAVLAEPEFTGEDSKAEVQEPSSAVTLITDANPEGGPSDEGAHR